MAVHRGERTSGEPRCDSGLHRSRARRSRRGRCLFRCLSGRTDADRREQRGAAHRNRVAGAESAHCPRLLRHPIQQQRLFIDRASARAAASVCDDRHKHWRSQCGAAARGRADRHLAGGCPEQLRRRQELRARSRRAMERQRAAHARPIVPGLRQLHPYGGYEPRRPARSKPRRQWRAADRRRPAVHLAVGRGRVGPQLGDVPDPETADARRRLPGVSTRSRSRATTPRRSAAVAAAAVRTSLRTTRTSKRNGLSRASFNAISSPFS